MPSGRSEDEGVLVLRARWRSIAMSDRAIVNERPGERAKLGACAVSTGREYAPAKERSERRVGGIMGEGAAPSAADGPAGCLGRGRA
jgi:hypothetical protein